MTDAALATIGEPVRSAGPRHDADLVGRLRKVTGQLSGVTRLIEISGTASRSWTSSQR